MRDRLLIGFLMFISGAWPNVAGAQADEARGARALFNDSSRRLSTPSAPDRGQRPNQPAPARTAPVTTAATATGVHYWLDLEGVGPVAETRAFATLERVRLHVRANVRGFLAVWAFDAGGRAARLLLSDGQAAMTLEAGMEHVSPPLRFRPPAGDERLLLVFARLSTDLPSFDVVEDERALAALAGAGPPTVLVEVIEATSEGVGTYVVRRGEGPVFREIRLRHEAP